MTKAKPKTPSHLSKESGAWYCKVAGEFVLDRHHQMMLQAACESWDRMQSARRAIQKGGLVFKDRFGQFRARPEIQIEKDSKVVFCRIVRELRLDESEPEPTRLPRNRRT